MNEASTTPTDVERAVTPGDWADVARVAGRDVASDAWVLVARQGGVTVGFVELQVRGEVVELVAFGVRPLAVGSGVGRRLLAAATAAASREGYRDVVVATPAGPAT